MTRKIHGPGLMEYRDRFTPFRGLQTPEKMATAAHEGAHAVVAAALGCRVTGVEIEHKGHTVYSWRGLCWYDHPDHIDETTQLTDSSVITVAALAGRARLEGTVRYHEPETLFESDARVFKAAANALDEDYGTFRAACLREAGELLDAHDATWRYVTYNLLHFERLDEDELRTIAPALFSQWEQRQNVALAPPVSLPGRTPAPPRRTTGRTMRDIVPGLRYGDAMPIGEVW